MANRFLSDAIGTLRSFWKVGAVRLKDNSGSLNVRNAGDSADAGLIASALTVSSLTAVGDLQANGSGVVSVRKHNLSASAAPTVNEDSGDGYAIGSVWLDTTADKAYIALDVTIGAAIWKETTNASAGMASFTLAGSSGSSQTITDGNTASILGATGVTTVASATDTVTAQLDINGLTEDTAPDVNADFVATYDASATTHKKTSIHTILKPNVDLVVPNASMEFYNNVVPTSGVGTPAFAPLSWRAGSNTTLTVESGAGNFKHGARSAKLVTASGGSTNALISNLLEINGGAGYIGDKTFTVGCWVKTSNANACRVGIGDNSTESFSSYHTGGGAFEWLTATHTVTSSPTAFRVLASQENVATAYYDGWRVVEGSVCIPERASSFTSIEMYTPIVLFDELQDGTTRFDCNNIQGDYEEIEIIAWLRSSVSAATDSVYLMFNNDSTAGNYRSQYIRGSGSTASAAAADTPFIGLCPAATATANYFGYFNIKIKADPVASSIQRLARCNVFSRDGATAQRVETVGLHWESSANITRIQLQPDGYATDGFVLYSRCLILGWKKVQVLTAPANHTTMYP